MKSSTFRNLCGAIAALGISLLLGSCGGGGAGSSTSVGGASNGGAISIFPDNATFYAGVPSRITVSGGRTPYSLSSSEPTILDVPATFSGHDIDLIPANPGVVDSGLAPGALQIRTVTITARDSTGTFARASIAVAQNFLTGYGLSLSPSNCPSTSSGSGATATTTPTSACAGGDTIVRLAAVFNGTLYGDQPFRLDVASFTAAGVPYFQFKDPLTGALTNTVTTVSDHSGVVTVQITVPANSPTQVALIRVTHLPDGVYTNQAFTIQGVPSTTALTAIPSTVTITGALTTSCGTGSFDTLIFDGLPPYTATSTNSNITVTPSTSSTNPGRFTITANNPTLCGTFSVVIQDSVGRRATVTVITAAGTIAPTPPPTFAVSPATLTLACSTSGSVSAVGGSGSYSVTSTHPRVTAIVSGNTVTITRLSDAPLTVPPTAYPTTATVTVSDGTSLKDVTVTVPASCP